MAEFTTGEVAKQLNVTIRTVQYYDKCDLASPSRLSEGGRRLYSEEDVRRLKAVCFLRSLDLPISSIQKLLREESPENLIGMLISTKSAELQEQIEKSKATLARLEALKKELNTCPPLSVDSISDIAYIVDNKSALKALHKKMLIAGIFADFIEWPTLLIWILKGLWLPFVISLPLLLTVFAIITVSFVKNVRYLCPACHSVFAPRFLEMFFARHSPYTRRLTCPKCGRLGFAIEVYHDKKEEISNAQNHKPDQAL